MKHIITIIWTKHAFKTQWTKRKHRACEGEICSLSGELLGVRISEMNDSELGTTRIGAHTELNAASASASAPSADWCCLILTVECLSGRPAKSSSSVSVSLYDGSELSKLTGDSQSAVITQHTQLLQFILAKLFHKPTSCLYWQWKGTLLLPPTE